MGMTCPGRMVWEEIGDSKDDSLIARFRECLHLLNEGGEEIYPKPTCISLSFGSDIHLQNMNSADKTQRLDRFFAAHREGGLAVTTQRRAVFEAILDRSDHPTAEQLHRAVSRRLPQISRMTVHRILGAFISLGLVAARAHSAGVELPSAQLSCCP